MVAGTSEVDKTESGCTLDVFDSLSAEASRNNPKWRQKGSRGTKDQKAGSKQSLDEYQCSAGDGLGIEPSQTLE